MRQRPGLFGGCEGQDDGQGPNFGLAEASLVSPILFLRLPLIAVIAFFWFGQTTEIWTWIGAAVIFLATTWMTRVETREHSNEKTVN